ncbi:MAG: helix-turn-helix domain-containing protein [Acidithiobacillus sp.]|nr:helix-turn-helix domain-containing protein [Acidithiobacillus sp.]
MAEMEDRWLSVDEISKYLGISSDTVYRWIDKHAMPAHRMGRLWKFKKDEIDEWVKTGGAAEPAGKIAGSDFVRPKEARSVSSTDGTNQTDKKRKE